MRALVELPFSAIAGIDVLDLRRTQAAVFGGRSPDAAALAAAIGPAAIRGGNKAVMRVRAAGSELFFGVEDADPESLRGKVGSALQSVMLVGQLGQPAAASQPSPEQQPVQSALVHQPAQQAGRGGPAAAPFAAELVRLASLLDNGLLTHDEYQLLKSRLTQRS